MGRSQESFNKKEIRSKKEKKRKEKEQKRLARKDNEKKSGLDEMIAYVDENGLLSDSPPDPAKRKQVDVSNIQIHIPKKDDSIDKDYINQGVVSFYNESKGFGFIQESGSKQSIFFHANNLLEEVKEGNKVIYEKGAGQKGPVALQIKIYKETE